MTEYSKGGFVAGSKIPESAKVLRQGERIIKGYSLHHDDGTSETHVIKGNIPRASFFQHEGDFKDTVPTEPGALEQVPGLYCIDTYAAKVRSYKPAGMQRDNPYTARLLAIAVAAVAAISTYFIVWH